MANAPQHEEKRHSGKTIIVTGGSNGIGQAFVHRLAEEGAHILICDVADASESVALAAGAQGTVEWLRCNLTDSRSIADFASDIATRGIEVDAIVHAAGIYPMKPVDEIDFGEWRRVFAVNIDSLYFLVRAFLPGMRSRGWGRIVAITSNTFQLGVANLTHYVASKGAVIGFVRSLSREVGDWGITVNGVAPSITRTKTVENEPQRRELLEPLAKLQCIKRVAVPDDYAGTVSFLLSDDASFITGQNIVVDGGWTHS
ncbi:dehydrogenase [Sphingobium lactosutens]|uniref:SDR family NAD(P)-dependent oxidoreductase n=1 Tax=Sphingobium lactosutens TaxID=522773 RepID=UPI0015BB2558|nr:SDR family oxidoreductase [Sphingobium lactosutens]NWK97467.1 dehydrogenase [Sphingobium lactosutens]